MNKELLQQISKKLRILKGNIFKNLHLAGGVDKGKFLDSVKSKLDEVSNLNIPIICERLRQ